MFFKNCLFLKLSDLIEVNIYVYINIELLLNMGLINFINVLINIIINVLLVLI